MPNTGDEAGFDADQELALDASETALLQLHKLSNEEITRYRDVEWKVSSIVLAFLGAVITACSNATFAAALHNSIMLKYLFGAVAIALCALGWFFLSFTQEGLKSQRQLRAILETKLHLSDIVKKSIIPKSENAKKIALFYPIHTVLVLATWLTIVLVATR